MHSESNLTIFLTFHHYFIYHIRQD